MGYWDCPKCTTENSLDANSCRNCGYHFFGVARSAGASGDPFRKLRDSFQKESRGTLEEMRMGLARAHQKRDRND